ncbi:receptor-like serine/threonine-protein kinase ALE2-like isoform X1 [Hibiscus syriacus]|uniref:Receptor-like serine/threonine-protein kinase ALE2-like isoform X1 n=1 Tax=Hibiscus syriacus TaxID=106335 RepID=A0A6A3CAJ9_HIBSY|nr:receptor-like serine/threonine-protein kinase ALE2-like isoform X1 [Hibiscus syriacus]
MLVNLSNVDAVHVTRFLGLASVGNKEKLKFLHALSPTPSSAMSAAEISAKPSNTTLSPYTVVDQVDHHKEATKRASDNELDSQYWRYDVSNKRQRVGMVMLIKRCLDFIIKGKCEKGPDCNFKHSLQDDGESYSRRKPVSSISKANRSKDCWFCLSSPNVESHLQIVKLSLANSRTVSRCIIKTRGKKQCSLSGYLKRGTHANLQAVPVPSSKAAVLKDIFTLAAEKLGFEFVTKKFNNNSEGRKWLRTQFDKNVSCFYVELPDGSILLHLVEENEKFPAQFGREVVAGLLNMADRADWRNCTISKEEETKLTENFKKRFQDVGSVRILRLCSYAAEAPPQVLL